MLKSIFRTRKKSKAGLSTPSGKEINDNISLSSATGYSKPATANLLTNDEGRLSNDTVGPCMDTNTVGSNTTEKSTWTKQKTCKTDPRRHTLISMIDKFSLSQSSSKPKGLKKGLASSETNTNSCSGTANCSNKSRASGDGVDAENIPNCKVFLEGTFVAPYPVVVNEDGKTLSNHLNKTSNIHCDISRWNTFSHTSSSSATSHESGEPIGGMCPPSALPQVMNVCQEIKNESNLLTPKPLPTCAGDTNCLSEVVPLRTSTTLKERPVCNGLCTPAGSISLLPSPLNLRDLEQTVYSVSEGDDTIPDLVDINRPIKDEYVAEVDTGKPSAAAADAHHVSSQTTTVNESQMYILTDSFLDDSPASFLRSAAGNATVASNVLPHGNRDVMVANDYMPSVADTATCLNSICEPDATMEMPLFPVCTNGTAVVSGSAICHKTVTMHENSQQWHQKPLSEWTSSDVLAWVVAVGLGQFYETFRRNNVVGRDLAVISLKFLDHLNIFGQEAREFVLSRLYLLHVSNNSEQNYEEAFSVSVRKDRVFPPFISNWSTIQKVPGGSKIDTTTDEAQIVKQLCFDEVNQTNAHHMPVTVEVKHCLNGDAGVSSSTLVTLGPLMMAEDVIKQVLLENNKSAVESDSFQLLAWFNGGTAVNNVFEFEPQDLISERLSPRHGTVHFLEMKRHSTFDVKVIYFSDSSTPDVIKLQVRNSATCADVLGSAIRFLCITDGAAADYYLLMIGAPRHDADAKVCEVESDWIICDLSSRSFLLCDRNNPSQKHLQHLDLLELCQDEFLADNVTSSSNNESAPGLTADDEALTHSVGVNTDVSVEATTSQCSLSDQLAKLQQEVNELQDVIRKKNLTIERLEKVKTDVQTTHETTAPLQAVDGNWTIYQLLQQQTGTVTAVQLQHTVNGSLGFMLGVDTHNRPLVRHTEQGTVLHRGDRFLEVNGVFVGNMSESELYKTLKAAGGAVDVVVLRLLDHSGSSDDVESLREDLSLALLELEALQQENKDLNDELNRLKSGQRVNE